MADLPVVIMRGGTSKGVFLRLAHLPVEPAERDALLLRLMGSPDPMQLDGLGGTHSSTSKVMAIGPASEPGADIEYLFAQVAVDRPVVDLTGNCGNLTAAVAHYAVDEGLVAVCDPGTTLLMRNLNTGVIVRATVAVRDGRAEWLGDTTIDGVPGRGAALVTDYLEPAGAVTGELFPTGRPRDLIGDHEISVVDVASPYLFVRADAFGLSGNEMPDELNARLELLAELEALRAQVGGRIGVTSLAIPRLVLVSPGHHLRVQATSMGRVHHAIPITGALCVGAAARLRGTLVNDCAQPVEEPVNVVRIEHPKGAVEATIELDGDRVVSAGVIRTARRLLTGTAHL